jgi:hypothetical protein
MGPYHLYFNQTLFSHGNFTETELQRQTGYSSATSTDYVSPENQRAAQFAREDFRGVATVSPSPAPRTTGATRMCWAMRCVPTGIASDVSLPRRRW